MNTRKYTLYITVWHYYVPGLNGPLNGPLLIRKSHRVYYYCIGCLQILQKCVTNNIEIKTEGNHSLRSEDSIKYESVPFRYVTCKGYQLVTNSEALMITLKHVECDAILIHDVTTLW